MPTIWLRWTVMRFARLFWMMMVIAVFFLFALQTVFLIPSPVLTVLRLDALPVWAGVELTFSPDHVQSHTGEIIATSDGIVLDRCQRWVNLSWLIIAKRLPQARLLDVSSVGE